MHSGATELVPVRQIQELVLQRVEGKAATFRTFSFEASALVTSRLRRIEHNREIDLAGDSPLILIDSCDTKATRREKTS